ncbi:zinc knuckle CX2CX4HX4C containing protein [Tanacetum coccineum]
MIRASRRGALVHQTMESLKKIKINRPLLKEIRQTDNYAKQMKYLVENKPRTEEDNEIIMNPRCSALFQNHLPPKEQDLESFIHPCYIKKLDFKNALADLGASISIMPFSMYKHLGIGKLTPINMLIEMADNTKCTPKGIVKNLLIKINKFIFPVDFVILDMVEDIRMPIILGRPLLATAHAQVDIFRKTISLEVGSEKVIFKMRSSFTTTNFESVRLIKSETFVEDDNLKEIDYDLFLYDYESCLETKVKTLANEVEGRINNMKFEECKKIFTKDGLPLYTPFYYSPEEIEYFSANSGFSDNERQETDDSGMVEALAELEATVKKKKEEPKREKQNVNYYVDPYEPPIPFLR